MVAMARARSCRDRRGPSTRAMPMNSRTDNEGQMQTDRPSSFPLWFLQNIRRYQVYPGVVVDRPLGRGGSTWALYFGDKPGVPNAIMHADNFSTGVGNSWGRWIDEFRHRGLIVVTEASLQESLHLLRNLAVDDWPVQYQTADGRRVTIERKASIPRPPSLLGTPRLEFTAEGRADTLPLLIDYPNPHFLLTPKGFDWLDRAVASARERSASNEGKTTDLSSVGGKKKTKRPAWERLTLHRSSDGSDHTADLDGKRIRVRGNAAFKMLDVLQKEKGERVKASTLQDKINQRPDRVLKLLDKRLQRIIDPPKKGSVGYAMW